MCAALLCPGRHSAMEDTVMRAKSALLMMCLTPTAPVGAQSLFVPLRQSSSASVVGPDQEWGAVMKLAPGTSVRVTDVGSRPL